MNEFDTGYSVILISIVLGNLFFSLKTFKQSLECKYALKEITKELHHIKKSSV